MHVIQHSLPIFFLFYSSDKKFLFGSLTEVCIIKRLNASFAPDILTVVITFFSALFPVLQN